MRVIILTIILMVSRFLCAQTDSLPVAQDSGIFFNKNISLSEAAFVSPMQNKISFYDPLGTEINYPLLAGVGGIYLGSGIAVHIYQRNAWWRDQRRTFHFVNDNNYALGIDKIGHFYAGNLLAHAFSAGLEAGNLKQDQSAIYGSIGSFLFELYVEIEDGYGPDWGFSPGDLAGDFAGAAYALGQYYFPFLKNFQPRFSYYPTKDLIEGRHRGNMIDDYEGQKYWIGMRVRNLLPSGIAQYWPAFLMISVGMGVENLNGNGGGTRQFYIALDIDAEEIPLYGKGWQFIKNTLNYFHFPMPGIRVSPDAVFFVICF